MESNLALYVHDSPTTVPTTLVPLARAAYERQGVRGILVGPGNEDLDESLFSVNGERFLEVHPYRRYEHTPGYHGGLNRIPLVRWIREVSYWKRFARDLLTSYRPCAIFSTKRDIEDMLFLTKAATEEGIPSVQIFWSLIASEEFHRRRTRFNYDVAVADRHQFIRYMYRIRGQFKSAISNPVYRGFGVRWHNSPNIRRYSRFLALPNKSYKRLLVEDGMPADNLIPTGHPEDDIIRCYARQYSDPETRARMRREFGVPEQGTVAVYGNGLISNLRGEITEEEDRDIVRQVMSHLQEHGAFPVLKLHPSDDVSNYGWFREEFPDAMLIRDCDLYKLIAVSDLFVSQGSATTRWAVLAGVPSILVDVAGFDFMPFVTQLYGISAVRSIDEFNAKLKLALSGGMKEEMDSAYQVATGPAGDAIEHILELGGIDSDLKA